MNIISTDDYCDLRYDSRFLCEWFSLRCIFRNDGHDDGIFAEAFTKQASFITS